MAIASCWDHPSDVLERHGCLLPLSKDIEGFLSDPDRVERHCKDPGCVSLRWANSIKVELAPHVCDDPQLVSMNGTLSVGNLATAFAGDRSYYRGVHAGDFRWVIPPAGIVVVGRISGITNAGILREPPFTSCEECRQPGIMTGRLCGVISEAPPTHGQWLNSMVNAVYRWSFDLGGGGRIYGTLEGAITVVCREA